MATTRLRRTFHYPSDSDDPPDLDEEHQETLLQDLETTDQKTTTLYRYLFLALPLLTALYSILNPNYGHARLVRPDATGTALFLTFVQIAVPVLAGWILYYHPITESGFHGLLESLYAFFGKGTQQDQGDVKPKNARWLIVVGLSLSGILVIAAWAKRASMTVGFPEDPTGQVAIRRINGEYHEIADLLLPAGRFSPFYLTFASRTSQANGEYLVVFCLTLFVRQQLAPVDLQELREAKYGLKGA
jgi:hypothetical protein